MQINLKLSLAELWQLRAYVQDRDEGPQSGWFYGNREQFNKRHKNILAKLDRIIDALKERTADY